MAAQAVTAAFTAFLRGGLSGDKDVKVSWSLSAPLESTFQQVLTQGANNTITLPGAAQTLLIVIPPTTNTQTVTIKGVNGDTGYAAQVAVPSVHSIGTTLANIVINLGAGSNQTFTFIVL